VRRWLELFPRSSAYEFYPESSFVGAAVNPHSKLRTLILVCLVAFVSFLTAMLGGALVLRPQMLWPLWPGCALLVAILLLVPRRIWPILIVAGLTGFVLYDLQAGLTLRSIAILILSDTVEVLVAALGVSYAFDGVPRFNSIKSLAKYSVFAIILAPLAGTFIVATAFSGDYWIRWKIGFFTEALALLTVTPAILRRVSTGQSWIRKSRTFYFEEAVLNVGLILLGYLAFVSPTRTSLPALLYSLLPFLLWAALRFGVMGISTSMIVVAFLSISGAVHGQGPFTGAATLTNVISLQLFLFITAVTFIVFAVLVDTGKETERALRESEGRLSVAAEVGKMYAWEWDPATDTMLRSAECLDILGLSGAAGKGLAKDYFSSIHPDDRAKLRSLIDSLTEEDRVYRTQYRRFRPDGVLLWLEESGRATFDGGGKIIRLIGMTADITQRQQVEEALRESEIRERTRAKELGIIVDAVPLPIRIAHDAACRWMTGNRAAYEQERVPPGGNLSANAPPGEGPRYRLMENGVWVEPGRLPMQQAAATGKSVYGRALTLVYEDGTKRETVESAVPLLDEAGKPRGAVGTSIDLTELRQAEHDLRESQQLLSGIISSAMDSIISVDEQQRIVVFNTAAEKMFRCSAAGAIGQPVERFIPERFRSVHAKHIRQFGETGLTNRDKGALSSLWALRADGEEFEIEASISQIESSGKKLFTVILRDISERQRAEEALRQSEERFNKVFRSSPLAVTISTEAEGRYLDVNKAFLQTLGYERREVIGHTAQDLNFWAEPSEREEMIRQLQGNGQVADFHTQCKTSEGKKREVEVSAELVELDGQRCVLAITRDVTETRQLEAQFRQAQKMEAVGRFAGGVAHDFNNLLGVIIGYSDLSLPLTTPESLLKRYLEQIKQASYRAASLTKQLLAFSRQQVVFPKLLDLNEVLHNVADMLQRMVGEDVAISVQPTKPIGSVYADAGQIEQVLMNLVVNARDAMLGGGKIVIGTAHAELDEHYASQHPGAHTGQHVVLSVSDTGCGMDEGTISQIFEPFYTTKEVGKGTGLGLSTVYGIVKQSGGYISVDSQPGRGTTFKIYFPRVAAKAESLVRLDEGPEFPAGSETILLVEDEEALRDVALSLLQNAGYQVIAARNAEAGLEMLKAANPKIDLLLTDVIMPGKSGVELLEQAKAVHPNLRSLFISGYPGDLVSQRSGSVPEAAYLEKPFTRSSLLKKVRSVLQADPARQ